MQNGRLIVSACLGGWPLIFSRITVRFLASQSLDWTAGYRDLSWRFAETPLPRRGEPGSGHHTNAAKEMMPIDSKSSQPQACLTLQLEKRFGWSHFVNPLSKSNQSWQHGPLPNGSCAVHDMCLVPPIGDATHCGWTHK